MQFEYEIPLEEYAAAHVLYYRGYSKGKLVKRALGFTVVGLFFIFIAVSRWAVDWPPVLLLVTGGWFVYGGIASLYPTRYYRREYPAAEFAGKTFRATVIEEGFSVAGNSCNWQVQWSDVRLKAESKLVFMFSAKQQVFIFGKKYLTDEQQKAIRIFAAMRET